MIEIAQLGESHCDELGALFDVHGESLAQRARMAHEQIEMGPCGAVIANGKVVAVGGFWVQWQGRATLWWLFSRDAGKHAVALSRAMSRYMQSMHWRRLELYVPQRDDAHIGHRWARLLGFTHETPSGPMRSFMPDGADAHLYAWVRGGEAASGRLRVVR